MSDLISKGELFNALATAKDKADCFAVIQAAPTVDAVPVRHGHWTKDGACSECGMPVPTDDRLDYIRRDEVAYCCYCGAKMDGEETE